eukprot:50607-Amorphochlora_amoeboformis.AAC.1
MIGGTKNTAKDAGIYGETRNVTKRQSSRCLDVFDSMKDMDEEAEATHEKPVRVRTTRRSISRWDYMEAMEAEVRTSDTRQRKKGLDCWDFDF